MKAQKLNRRQARWALYLFRFNFTLKHVPGSKMGKADSLSRRPDWEIGVEKDNEDEMLVKPEWLEVRKTEAVEIIVDRVDLLEEVRKSKVKDDEVVKAVEEMKQAGVKMLRDKEWREVDGIMYKEGKVYVPKDEKSRCHDLAKWLSHYLYFFSFLFLFLWTYNYKVEHGKVSHDFVTMSQWCDGWSQMVTSQVTVTECHITRVT